MRRWLPFPHLPACLALLLTLTACFCVCAALLYNNIYYYWEHLCPFFGAPHFLHLYSLLFLSPSPSPSPSPSHAPSSSSAAAFVRFLPPFRVVPFPPASFLLVFVNTTRSGAVAVGLVAGSYPRQPASTSDASINST